VPVNPPPISPPAGVVFFDGTQPLPPPTQVLLTPTNCSGWPEPRVYIEGQVILSLTTFFCLAKRADLTQNLFQHIFSSPPPSPSHDNTTH
jgi:hypothetical protein